MKKKVKALSQKRIDEILGGLVQATKPGKSNDGTRVHLHYKAMHEPSQSAMIEAKRSEDLGLSRDRYTGRVDRVWVSGNGDKMLTMLVELERDHKFRTFNLSRGKVFNIVILGI